MKMRSKVYQDANVLDAAKERIRYLLTQYDHVYVAFSGGKDSWVAANLLHEVRQEMGMVGKVKLVFNDEEVITTSIVKFVEEVHDGDKFDLVWLSIRMSVGMNIMCKYHQFISWDTSRKWHRQPPEYAIRDIGVDTSLLDEYVLNKHICNYLYPTGKVCTITGVRADESVKRLMAVTANVADNYIAVSPHNPRLSNAKPIYDWSERDVFKYLYESKSGYCPVYNLQYWSRVGLRVATTLNDKAKETLFAMKQMEPDYYEALTSVLPEVETSLRYSSSVDRVAAIEKYEKTFDGLRALARDHVGDELLEEAMSYIASAESTRAKFEKRGFLLGRMPLSYLFKKIHSGGFWGEPPKVADRVTQADIDFESKHN